MGVIIDDRNELLKRIQTVRASNGKVIFANGAFDILHAGHVRYLEGAAALGDLLVVAVNSDSSVARLKGAGRPLMPLADRMRIVAALEVVDLVCSFDEPTVEQLLLLLKPDVHAKGTDYTKDSVPEVETVRSYGGQVAITGDPKDHSTTDLISKVIKIVLEEQRR